MGVCDVKHILLRLCLACALLSSILKVADGGNQEYRSWTQARSCLNTTMEYWCARNTEHQHRRTMAGFGVGNVASAKKSKSRHCEKTVCLTIKLNMKVVSRWWRGGVQICGTNIS